MPQYLNLLREASAASIYILFVEVILLLLLKGKVKDRDLQIFAYILLPIAVTTQLLMTHFRYNLNISNLSVMNIYLMIEFVILVLILLRIRKKVKGVEANYKIWSAIILGGILIHFINELNSLHTAAMLYTAIIFFNLTMSFIDMDNVEEFFKDPYALLNIGIFVKAFGYSYFTIYQIDYRFPLSVYSAVNLLVQIIFFLLIYTYYLKEQKERAKS